jgi:hypothetical protein
LEEAVTVIDRRYRQGGTLATSAVFAWLGILVTGLAEGATWGRLLAVLGGGLIAGIGFRAAAGELAKPCRPVDPEVPDIPRTGGTVSPIPPPRSLRDERGSA